METTEKQEVAVAVLETAPQILLKNQNSRDNARKVYDQIFSLINAQGMNQVYDDQLKKFADKCKLTLKAANDERAPITQTLDRIKKEFTIIESDLKSMIDGSQGKRNEYASALMAEQKKKEEEQRRKLEKEKEVIDLKRFITISYKEKFSDITTDLKTDNIKWFNDLKLDAAPDTIKESAILHISSISKPETKEIISMSKIDLTRFIDGGTIFTPIYSTPDEVKEFAKTIYYEILPNFEAELEKELALQKQELLDKLPSKISELEELALADAAEAEKILEEKRRREAEEAEKIRSEAEEKKQKENAEAQIQAAGDKAAASVDATLFDTPKVAESYEIKVTNRAAWAFIFQFWFEHDGKSLTDDKLEKYTMSRMKAFCEKWAKDKEEFIKTPGITYEAVYKAK